MNTLRLGQLEKIDHIIKGLELVDKERVAVVHFTFVLSAVGASFAERLTREKT